MVTLQTLPIDYLPHTLQDLLIVVVMALLGMAWFVIKAWLTARDVAREQVFLGKRHAEIVATQDRIAAVLENHLGEIGQHMAVSNETLRLISTRLLDEAFKDR